MVRSSSPGGHKIFLLSTSSTPVRGPPSLISNGYGGVLSLEIKRPGREADHSSQTSARSRIHRSRYPILHTSSWSSAKLVRHRDRFYYLGYNVLYCLYLIILPYFTYFEKNKSRPVLSSCCLCVCLSP
jgi:hypothetical protein